MVRFVVLIAVYGIAFCCELMAAESLSPSSSNKIAEVPLSKAEIGTQKDLESSGIRLTFRDGHHSILFVDPNSEAAKAGMRVEDVLVSVDGQPLFNLDSKTVQNLLNGTEGAKAELTLQSDGKLKRISYIRKTLPTPISQSSDQPKAELGLDLKPTSHGTVLVVNVKPGSIAEKSGLIAGDEIIEVNGFQTKLTPMRALAPEIRKSMVIFKTVRKDRPTIAEIKIER
jgi:C-terminal processing protease CtpA/Prc